MRCCRIQKENTNIRWVLHFLLFRENAKQITLSPCFSSISLLVSLPSFSLVWQHIFAHPRYFLQRPMKFYARAICRLHFHHADALDATTRVAEKNRDAHMTRDALVITCIEGMRRKKRSRTRDWPAFVARSIDREARTRDAASCDGWERRDTQMEEWLGSVWAIEMAINIRFRSSDARSVIIAVTHDIIVQCR